MAQRQERGDSLSERLRAPGATATGHLTVTLTFCERRALLMIVGELDRMGVGQLESRLAEAIGLGAEHLVVDLSPTQFIDSFGLLALADAAEALPPGGQVTLVGTTEIHQRLLHLLGVRDCFDIA